MSLYFFQVVAIISGAFVAFGGLLYGLWRLIRKIVYIADAVQQLHPGSGKSVADKIDSINFKVSRLEERIARLERKFENF